MTIVKHEMKQGRKSLFLWTLGIGALLSICVFLFPEMKGQMESVNDAFASMGAFTDAFGMDRLNYGSLVGFYAIECGNILGLGGAFFSALCGAAALSKEEHEHTAEFMFTHPVSRKRVVTEKLVAVLLQVTLLNVLVYAIAVGSLVAIGETVPWKEVNLLHVAYYLMQLEVAAICFGISAFIRKGSAGLGLGLAILMYFLNLIANITEKAEFLKMISPYGYCEAADIITDGALDGTLIGIGAAIGVMGVVLAYFKYIKKDIR